LILLVVVFIVAAPSFVNAQDDIRGGLSAVGSAAGLGTTPKTSFVKIIATLINVLFSVLGVIFLILLIYAGFIYLTAMGETKKAEEGMRLIKYAVFGIIIILAAYAISNFITSRLIKPIQTGSQGDILPAGKNLLFGPDDL